MAKNYVGTYVRDVVQESYSIPVVPQFKWVPASNDDDHVMGFTLKFPGCIFSGDAIDSFRRIIGSTEFQVDDGTGKMYALNGLNGTSRAAAVISHEFNPGIRDVCYGDTKFDVILLCTDCHYVNNITEIVGACIECMMSSARIMRVRNITMSTAHIECNVQMDVRPKAAYAHIML